MVARLQIEDRFRTFFESTNDGIIVLDTSFTIVYSNTLAGVIFGYDKEELLHTNITQLFPYRLDSYLNSIKDLLPNEGRSFTLKEMIGRRKDNRDFRAEVYCQTATFDREPVILLFISESSFPIGKEHSIDTGQTTPSSLATQITRRDPVGIPKFVNPTERASQITLSSIAKNFPNGVIIVINDDYFIEFAEGEELDKLGIKKEVVYGKHIDDLTFLSETQKSRLKNDIRRTLNGAHNTFETEFKNNTYAVNTTPLSINEKGKKALLVYYNISQRKKYETEIRNALQKEYELNKLKSEFIALASHEFRTPLSAILSSANMIQKLTDQDHQFKREKYVDIIKANVHNLTIILDDFLSLEKLKEDKEVFIKRWIRPDLFISGIIEQIKPSMKAGQNIRILKKNLNRKIHTDPKLLEHIVINLISNAIKFSPENTAITITLETAGAAFRFSIKDQGIGIAEEERKNLFQRFFRAKNTSHIEGTGLGLHIAKQYTKLLGGSISFKSKINSGSTFTVEIPSGENLTDHENNFIN